MENHETPKPCWSNILKSGAAPKSEVPSSGEVLSGVLAASCKSTKGIAVAIVDANAVIEGGERLALCADKFVSVPEVMDEIRDPVSRHRLAVLPFSVQTMEPSPESLNKVVKFARATGDLQTLSDVDLKLIALTHTLELQIHGPERLRDCPPPIQTVNVKRFQEKELPGWGSNVPNLEEWEALENVTELKPSKDSRILPLKDLSLNVALDAGSECQEVGESNNGRPRRYMPVKKEVNIEGKIVAEGIDASGGDHDAKEGDWMPAVSRSTHRRFLRRKARHDYYNSNSEKDEVSENNDAVEEKNNEESVAAILEELRLGEGPSKETLEEEMSGDEEGEHVDISEEPENSEVSSEINESVEESSEQSWTIRSLSESSVACVTTDFAMQNVLLQMGLRLVAPGGMQIRQLHRWVLRCHACYTVTAEIGKIFCPKCGNGGTLRKVAVTVGENGITLATRKPRIILRGTKFSLPLPQGGRDAVAKNLILREDQLPQKYLYPKNKKKVNKERDDYSMDNIFDVHHSDKKSQFQPPVRKALADFTSKRNPNDNHYSRSKRN